MIPPEQLSGALGRLDPRERELLALSLRRRVPDEALARVYDVVPQEIARRRAAAIERLADELGAQRGEDLGAVLQALLDEGTWTAGEADGRGARAAEQEVSRPRRAGRHSMKLSRGGGGGRGARSSPFRPSPSSRCWPRERVCAGPDADEPGEEGARRGVVAIAVASFVAAVIGGAAAFVGLSQWDDGGHGGGTASAQPPNEGMQHFVPQLGGPFEAPFPSDPEPLSCFSDRLDDRSDDAVQEAGRRGAHQAVVPDRVGLAADPRRDPPSRRLGLRAGTGARQRRGRLDGDEPSTDRLRALGDAGEPEEEAPLRRSTTARPCAAS